MVSYYKTSAIKLITVLRTPLFSKFSQNKDNIFRLTREGNSQRVAQYIQDGGDPDLQGHWHVKTNRTESITMRWSLLCEGAAFGHVSVLELLARAVGVKNVNKMSLALWIACRYGHLNLVRWLIEHTQCVVAACPRNLLLTSVENGHFDIAKYLLENELFADVDVQNDDQDSLLNIVIARQVQDGRSPLHEAAELNDVEAARMLLSSSGGECYVDVKDNNGLTPLHVACQMGHTQVAEILVYHLADASICNNFGQNCVEVAMAAGHTTLAKYVEEPLSSIRIASSKKKNQLEQECNASLNACKHKNPFQLLVFKVILPTVYCLRSVFVKCRRRTSEESLTKDKDENMLTVSDWDIFSIIIDELASRLLGKFRPGIRVSKVSGVGETCLNEVQYGQLAYNMLIGMRFGKSMVLENIHKFWEESLNRITSLIIARSTDQRVLLRINALLLQAIDLFMKLFDVKPHSNSNVADNQKIALEDFERNVERVVAFTRQLSSDDRALKIVVSHLKLPNSETLNFSQCDDTPTADINRNESQSDENYEWSESAEAKVSKKSLSGISNQNLNPDFDLEHNSLDIDASNKVAQTTFMKSDTVLLVTTIAKIHREFLQNIDLKIGYSMWVAYIAFFGHMRDLQKSRSSWSWPNFKALFF
jgi:hypothetical protein